MSEGIRALRLQGGHKRCDVCREVGEALSVEVDVYRYWEKCKDDRHTVIYWMCDRCARRLADQLVREIAVGVERNAAELSKNGAGAANVWGGDIHLGAGLLEEE